MWINFYQNAMAGIRQWFESLYFAPAPKLIKVRVKQTTAPQRIGARRRRVHHSNS